MTGPTDDEIAEAWAALVASGSYPGADVDSQKKHFQAAVKIRRRERQQDAAWAAWWDLVERAIAAEDGR